LLIVVVAVNPHHLRCCRYVCVCLFMHLFFGPLVQVLMVARLDLYSFLASSSIAFPKANVWRWEGGARILWKRV
jgi:hypothetical protein